MSLDGQWWSDENQILSALLFKHLFGAAVAGAQNAAAQLAEEFAGGVDWELVNQAALEWAKRASPELARSINATSQKFVTTAMEQWIASGLPKDELIKTLAPMFGKVRAEMIGTTEITRAFTEGNRAAWKESNMVSEVRWMSAEDKHVCSICGELDGHTYPINSDALPPAHVNCRCYVQPVVD